MLDISNKRVGTVQKERTSLMACVAPTSARRYMLGGWVLGFLSLGSWVCWACSGHLLPASSDRRSTSIDQTVVATAGPVVVVVPVTGTAVVVVVALTGTVV